MTSVRFSRAACVGTAVALLALAAPALATDQAATEPAKAESTTETAATAPTIARIDSTFRPPLLAPPPFAGGSDGLMAAIDPVTGVLRAPTHAERLALAAQATQQTTLRRALRAVEHRHADGSVSLALDPALYSMSTVVITADGATRFLCGDAGHAGHAHPLTPAAAPAAEER
jgi:hypothetical protein